MEGTFYEYNKRPASGAEIYSMLEQNYKIIGVKPNRIMK